MPPAELSIVKFTLRSGESFQKMFSSMSFRICTNKSNEYLTFSDDCCLYEIIKHSFTCNGIFIHFTKAICFVRMVSTIKVSQILFFKDTVILFFTILITLIDNFQVIIIIALISAMASRQKDIFLSEALALFS